MKSRFSNSPVRARIILEGVVQGVGYRPFVHRLATDYGLKGYVLNSSRGLIIEVEGGREKVKEFCRRISADRPPLAVLRSKNVEWLSPCGYRKFVIRRSKRVEKKFTLVSPDITVCTDCLREINNPSDRRFRYPFTNCTNCGPRFSIIKDTPYDRPLTTMAAFSMCRICAKEYADINDRRYHAQPNACSVCGPRVELQDKRSVKMIYPEPIKKAAGMLVKGKILAVKGIGGFHLTCDATDSRAVGKIRRLKNRERKPLALMSGSVEKMKKFCVVSVREEALLESIERPVVLLKKKKNTAVSELIAPGNAYLGVMLPYSPLHYLLLDDERLLAVVATSANIADEPIAREKEEIPSRIRKGCDYFLIHNRPIYNRCDDSVTAVVEEKATVLRRSRGYAPLSMKLPEGNQHLLAVGCEEKNTVCLTRDGWAYLSQHLGDLKGEEAFAFFLETVERMKKIFKVVPELVVYDLHPEYLSTRYAQRLKVRRFGVQHHHAHVASCMAEHGIRDKVIGIAFDGTGFGTDGTIWGGEFLLADLNGFERLAHIEPTPMPGGDRAVHEPQRIAAAFLHSAYGDEIFNLDLDIIGRMGKDKLKMIVRMLERGVNCPLSSGCGRLFDAVASLAGICDRISYEAQGPIELEAVSNEKVKSFYPYHIEKVNGTLIIDPRPVFRGIVRDLRKNADVSLIGGKFHNTVLEFSADVCGKIRAVRKIKKVVLSGGVFQNRLLLEKMAKRLKRDGFKVYTHLSVPTNDGGIAFGQAAIGLAYLNSS